MQSLRRAGFIGALVGTFVLGGFILPAADDRSGAELFRDVLTLVSTRYVDTLDVSEVYERAAQGLVERLEDPYATLFSPEQLEEFTVAYEGHYAGVGMLIEAQQGAAVVRRVFPNTPAERIGVLVGDRILAVDADPVAGWPLERIANALKGEAGSQVEVRFGRVGVPGPIIARITRAVVRIPAVPYATVVEDGVGYIPLLQFNETAADEVSSAVGRLVKEGATGLVLDLRGNGGGIVDHAVRIAGLFLPRGADIALQSERGSDDTWYRNTAPPLAPDLPLVVLIDAGSASASEIVAGALQDHDRAVVLGTTSFGKGLVQTAYRVDGGYVLKMTTGKWFTPSGRSIHRDRKLVDGRLLEVDDSTHFSVDRAERPTYHSDGGRLVYGGGGITPDLEIDVDTLRAGDQKLIAAIRPRSPAFSVTTFDYAFELKGRVGRDFQVTQAWRDELYRRLVAADVGIERATWDGGAGYIDRYLRDLVGRLAFGDAYAKMRDAKDDTQLMKAVEVIRNGGSQQRGLFGYVERVKGASG
ncbi:MAG TPA: S41 family peptidase [Longimicrobiales bacterium]|nr:S41 family peptidase [Longimicrobiales bacterium]